MTKDLTDMIFGTSPSPPEMKVLIGQDAYFALKAIGDPSTWPKPETFKAPLKVTLMRNEDRREIEVPIDPAYPHDRYMWEDGNYECDCNRMLQFDQATGEIEFVQPGDDGSEDAEEDWPEVPCGSQVLFSCRMVDADGKVVFEDGLYKASP